MLGGDLTAREGGAVAEHRRMLRVELRDPHDRDAARGAAPRDDRHLVAGALRGPGMHAHDVLDASEDGWRGVVDEDDAPRPAAHTPAGAEARATRDPPPVTVTLRPERRTRNVMRES